MAIKIMKDSKKIYQLSCLFAIQTSAEKIEQSAQEIKKWVESNEGEIVKTEAPGKESALKQQLAYPVKKQREAFLWSVSFTLDTQKLGEFGQYLDANHDIIRHLVRIRK